MQRSLVARSAGVATPAVLGKTGPLSLSFDRVIAAQPPSLAEMLSVLQALHRMPPDGLYRFDPFLRIRPRLGAAPSHVHALVTALEMQDAALGWPDRTVIHGDFHPGQTLRDRSGKVWLLDLDDLALAPPEADLGNLAAWFATRTEGRLDVLARTALAQTLALSSAADTALAGHFFHVALVRRALKLAEKGQPWALDQLPLRT
ncbi:MAG: phosphotransferase [Paracoccaceae bacterium]